MTSNKTYVNIGISGETAEFVCDSLKSWWLNIGNSDHPKANEILMFCDSGGANSYRHHIFKSEVQNLVNEINIPIKIVHYLPYTSKWNPIEHRVFPHITRTLAGVPLNTIDEAKTKTGLTVTADIIKKTYATGKRVAKDFIKNLKIKFSDSVPKLNDIISPAGPDCIKVTL